MFNNDLGGRSDREPLTKSVSCNFYVYSFLLLHGIELSRIFFREYISIFSSFVFHNFLERGFSTNIEFESEVPSHDKIRPLLEVSNCQVS